MVLLCYESNIAEDSDLLNIEKTLNSMVDARYRMTGSSGDELEVSGVTTGEEEDPDSMDSGQLSTKSYKIESALEIIPINDENNGTQTHTENAHRRKKTPHQYLENNDINDYDTIQCKTNSYSPPRNSLEQRAENLRVKSVESILKNNNKFNDLKDIRVKNQDLVIPAELSVRSGRDAVEGVWARGTILRGIRYGPFVGKWASVPADQKYAWEVIAGAGVRGWLDASHEPTNWLKFIRSSNNNHEVNLQHSLSAGQLWYCVSRDIPIGGELVLGPREPLLLQELLQTHPAGDRNDKDGGSQHSGTVEDEREEEDTEDSNEFRCPVCDTLFQDLELLDDHLVNAHLYPAGQHHCEVCPKSYCFRPGLLRHRAIAHSELRRYPCENCPKVFTDPSNLQRHIRQHHVGARSHACPECSKTFATSSGLKQHTHIHSSIKPFRCEVCFKAYTQFSNLCRHKRMHADCQVQIKCLKCGQSFSTSTSLSKHKRFCDSTGPAPPQTNGNQVRQLPQLPFSQLPNMQVNNSHSQNPFAMYRPPAALPFPFPPNFGPYPGLFHHSAPPAFLTNPLLFNSHLNRSQLEMESAHNNLPALERSSSVDSQKRISDGNAEANLQDSEIKERTLRNHLEKLFNTKDRFTPPRHQSYLSKVSPPTAEEASSQLLPSPARPPIRNISTSIFNHPRESHSSHSRNSDGISTKTETKSPERDVLQPRDFSKNSKPQSDVKLLEIEGESIKSSSKTANDKCEVNGEQPLDLSITRKEKDDNTYKDEEDACIPGSSSNRSSVSPKSLKRSFNEVDSIKSPENETIDIDVEEEKRTPSPKRPALDKLTATSTIAYPRPIHSAYLEAMYRPGGFPDFSGAGQRLLGPPPSPFVRAGSFPFLGPLLGANGGNRNFDLLRAPLPNYTNKYQDALLGSNHGGKLKDRYGCKFCGKVFPRSANLTRHLRTHTGEQPYKCKYCERSFSISSNLQRHVRNIHKKEKPFKCSLCDRCFGQQTNLDRHLKKHEAEEAGVGPIADSPGSSNETEREEPCEEIRSFMGKVAYSGHNPYLSTSLPFNLYNPHQGSEHKDEDDDSESFASEDMNDDIISRNELALSRYDSLKIKQEKDELLNNNESVIEVST